MDDKEDIYPSFRTEKYLWFRSKLEVDLIDIDEDLMQIPVLIQDAGEACAMASELRERAKEGLETTRAQVAQHLRESPVTAGSRARSETQIESQLPLFEPYVTAKNALSQARLDASLWTTMVEALRSKSAMIRVSADLLNSGFITPDFVRNKRRKEIRDAKVQA